MGANEELNPEQLEWIRVAATEGVPLSWIAETVSRHYSTVQKLVKEWGVALDPDWLTVQIECRRHFPDLHELFSPMK